MTDYSSELEKLALQLYQRGKNEVKPEVYLPYAKAKLEALLRRVEVKTSIARLRSLPDVRLGGDDAQWFEDYLWAEIEKLEAELKELEGEQG